MNLIEIYLIYLIKGNTFIILYIISINKLEIKSFFLLILELIVILLLI
jgi:hypothetical protein